MFDSSTNDGGCQDVRVEPGGGPRDGADGGHHPRHPGQRLPRPQRAEQVRHTGRGDHGYLGMAGRQSIKCQKQAKGPLANMFSWHFYYPLTIYEVTSFSTLQVSDKTETGRYSARVRSQ